MMALKQQKNRNERVVGAKGGSTSRPPLAGLLGKKRKERPTLESCIQVGLEATGAELAQAEARTCLVARKGGPPRCRSREASFDGLQWSPEWPGGSEPALRGEEHLGKKAGPASIQPSKERPVLLHLHHVRRCCWPMPRTRKIHCRANHFNKAIRPTLRNPNKRCAVRALGF